MRPTSLARGACHDDIFANARAVEGYRLNSAAALIGDWGGRFLGIKGGASEGDGSWEGKSYGNLWKHNIHLFRQ